MERSRSVHIQLDQAIRSYEHLRRGEFDRFSRVCIAWGGPWQRSASRSD